MVQESQIKENDLTELRRSEIKTIAESVMDEKFRNWKRTIIFFAVTFFLAMILLVVIGVLCIGDLARTLSDLTSIANDNQAPTLTIERNGLLSADYLAAVIPILLALGGSFIAFLGMNRLKMFDERIDQTRTAMLNEIESKVKSEVAIDRTEFSNQILQGISSEQEKFLDIVDGASNALLEKKEMCIKDIVDEFNRFEQKYAWLEATVTHKEADLDFYTIEDAHILVQQLRAKKPTGYIGIITKIVNRVCTADGLSGSSSDYHNLATELASGRMYDDACRVLEKGKTRFENDVDILAGIIEYSTNGGLNYAAEAVTTLEEMQPRIWTWRCYEFICDYYRSIGNLDKANELCDEFMDVFPNDEHGYRSKAEIIKLLYPGIDGIEKSIKILQRAIDTNVNCPQCANALAETYLSIGKYDEALSAANRAVLELAQEQPHVNVAYVFYNRATIKDRMFMQGLESSEIKQALVDAAYTDYRMALNLGGLNYTVSEQANVRIKILSRYVTPDLIQGHKDEDSELLLSLLSRLASENQDNEDDS